MSSNKRASDLSGLRAGERAVLHHIDLPSGEAQRLMELGFLPGASVEAALCAPGGDPRVYRVDGAEIALRRETARKLLVLTPAEAPCSESADAVRI